MDLESFLLQPYGCYLLDSVLVIYCLIATFLYFREKFVSSPSVAVGPPEENGRIYQELGRFGDADPYQVLQPSKKRKKAAKKQKAEPSTAEDRGRDLFESPQTPQ